MTTVRLARLALIAPIAIVALAAERPAAAQDYEAAGKHFAAAQEAFDKKQFTKAADEYGEAYNITRDPVLLYNIADAYEKGARWQQAVNYFTLYLEEAPKAQDHDAVARRVAELEKKHHVKAKKPKLAPAATPPPATTTPTTPAPATPPPATTTTPPPATTTTTKPGDKPSGGLMTMQGEPEAKKEPQNTLVAPPSERKPAPSEMAHQEAEHAATPLPPPSTTVTEEKAPPPPVVVAEPPPAPLAGPLDDDRPSGLKKGAWIGVAATVALVTAGAIFGLAAQSRGDEISRRYIATGPDGQPGVYDTMEQQQIKDLRNEGQTYNAVAIGLLCGAGATAIVSGVLFFMDSRSKPAEKPSAFRFSPQLGPGQAGAAAAWSF